jgi:aconitate hydratase 2/2-methylisocitrate dehydratase
LHDKPAFPDTLHVVAFVVPGETNTDDFSPASEGMTRQDIPLHALSMLANKMPDALPEITQLKQLGFQVAYVGDTVGTGSSRKSAINSLAYHTGNDIPGVPNKRVAPVVIGGKIAPIFKNATATAGGVAIECDISEIQNGDILLINFDDGNISKDGQVIASFTVDDTSKDVYRVGGTIPYKAGSGLTNRVRRVLGMETMQFGAPIQDDPNTQYTLAQKMVGAACGLRGVLPGTECEPVMTTVGSQDTTGPMTRAEMEELACLGFTADAVLQSFCHTAAHPKPEDLITQATLAPFISERGGISLKPGDGIIHSWLNRLVLPDTVGTGGDSHTRFPLGISFPADSGMVAYAATMGTMPIKMPESVLVKFVGELQPGITLRDVVNAIPYAAMQQGKVVYDEAKGTTTKNVFNGRIMEMEGLPDIKIEQAFELMDATAERSCAAGCIQLGIATVTEWLNSCVALLEAMIDAGYEDARTLQRRVDRMREWLANPALMTADAGATYADVVIVDLSAITEPIVAAPNNPDNIKLLSEVAGQPLDHVFVGSCQTNVGHYRATANVLEGEKVAVPTLVVPPTKQDAIILQVEGYWATLGAANCYTEGEWDFPVPGCSLCMGNQRRVDNATIFSTSTRNFNNRMGKGSNVYLGSAELAAVCGLLGRIPTVEEYLEVVARKVNPFASELYRFANFDQMQNVRELLAA